MLSKLIAGRSVVGIIGAVLAAILILIFMLNWDLYGQDLSNHWLLGQLSFSPVSSKIASIIAIISTAFVVRFQINRGALSQSKGSHHLVLIPLFACLAGDVQSFVQIAAACISGISILMMVSIPAQENRRDPVFHSGIVFGTGVLLAPSLIWLSIILLVVMLRIGKIAWRNWIALMLGIFFPFVILTTIGLVFNFPEGLVAAFVSALNISNARPELMGWIIPALMILAGMIGLFASYPPLTVRDKTTLQCYGIWLLGSTVLVIIGCVHTATAMVCVAIPAAVICSRWFEFLNRKWIVDLAYVALVVALLI